MAQNQLGFQYGHETTSRKKLEQNSALPEIYANHHSESNSFIHSSLGLL